MLEKLLAKRHVTHLDLSSVRQKVCEKLGWSAEKAEQVELEYKRFLYALAHKRAEDVVSPPSTDVDEFWHQHILDTRKYRQDCEKIFGHYMDHTPGLGTQAQAMADSRRDEIYSLYSINSLLFNSSRDSSYYSSDYTPVGCGSGDSSQSSHTGHSGNTCHPSGDSGSDASGHDGSADCSDSGSGDSGGGDSGGCDSGGGDGGSSCGGGDGGGGCGGGGCGGS